MINTKKYLFHTEVENINMTIKTGKGRNLFIK